LSIIKHVTLQTIVAHDFQYDPRRNKTDKEKIVMSQAGDQIVTQYKRTAALAKEINPVKLSVQAVNQRIQS
jgi:hypothetical protein